MLPRVQEISCRNSTLRAEDAARGEVDANNSSPICEVRVYHEAALAKHKLPVRVTAEKRFAFLSLAVRRQVSDAAFEFPLQAGISEGFIFAPVSRGRGATL